MFHSFASSASSSQSTTSTANALTKKQIINQVLEECKARMVYQRELLSHFMTTAPILSDDGAHYYLYGRSIFRINDSDPKKATLSLINLFKKKYLFYKFILEIFEKKPKNYVDTLCLLFEKQVLDEETDIPGFMGDKSKLTSFEKNMLFEHIFLNTIKTKLENATDPSYAKFKKVITFKPKHNAKKIITIRTDFSHYMDLLKEKSDYINNRLPTSEPEDAHLANVYISFSTDAKAQINRVNSNYKGFESKLIAFGEITNPTLDSLKTMIEDCRTTFKIAESFASKFEAVDTKLTHHLDLIKALNEIKDNFSDEAKTIFELGNKACHTQENLIIKMREYTINLNENPKTLRKILDFQNTFVDNLKSKVATFKEKASEVYSAYSIENHEDTVATLSLIIEEVKALKDDIDEFSIKNLERLEKLKEEHIKKASDLIESENIERENTKALIQETKRRHEERLKALREKNSEDKRLRQMAKDKALAETLAKASIVTEEIDEKNEAEILAMTQSAQNIYSQLNPTHKRLLAEIFAKPVPHYTISYDSLKHFITAMGGSIESPGGGSSHRKVTLDSSMAYFDMFEDDNEAMTEDSKVVTATTAVTSVVQAHKNGVPRGMLSRVDINNIRDLLERRYITPDLEKTASLENSIRSNEKLKM